MEIQKVISRPTLSDLVRRKKRSMPILDLETSVYPANLFEGYTQEASDRSWWVLYTKSRQEKAVARQLLTWTVPFYLPLVGIRT